ncbi:MAG: TolC family protein [Phycisphaerae bacterium]|nr:TolC family protein [Phycisphaerae bacterium]
MTMPTEGVERRGNRRWAGLVILGISVVATSCRAPSGSVESMLERHRTAMDRLPEEEQRMLEQFGDPEETERADDMLPADVLLLEQARSIAVRANPDVHAARARFNAAAARIDEARARYFPVVSFGHTSARTFHTPASLNRLNLAQLPQASTPIDLGDTQSIAVAALISALRRPLFGGSKFTGDRNSFSEHGTSLSLAWSAFDGFIREAQLLSTQYLFRAATFSLSDVERLIIQAVDQAYYQVQLAEEQLRIARADEAFSREQLDETAKLRKAGRASQADVDNFRVRMLSAQTNVTAAMGLRETGLVVLAELMGIPASKLPEALSLSPLETETEKDMTAPDNAEWVGLAFERRPDLKQLNQLLKSEEQQVRANRGLYSPSVNVSASWGFDRSSNLHYSKEDQSTAAGLEVRWDLFTGGARSSRVRQAEARRAEAAARLERRRLAVQAEVHQAVIDVHNAQEQIRLSREALDVARENRRIVQAAYVAGREPLTRLNETQRDFIAADADLVRARIRLRLAWSDLNAAAATYVSNLAQESSEKPPVEP